MNKDLFKSTSSAIKVQPTNTTTNAGGIAYKLSDKQALAQFATTGTINDTFYSTAEAQLQKLLELTSKCSTDFIARLAVYARQKSHMKDMPAFLTAIVAARSTNYLTRIFDKVIDNPKMLRNFVQTIRSGVVGRKSFGTRPKKLIQNYLNNLTDDQLFKADIGNDPSLADIIKMVRPRPANKSRQALYAYILGKEYVSKDLPQLVKDFEDFKENLGKVIPEVPFQMLTALPLKESHWKQIAKNATWNQIRQNLNTFQRHNVFSDANITKEIATKLSDEELILSPKTKAFPYQLFTAYQNVEATMPKQITNALQKAAEVALRNIPEFDGKVYVMVDVSGSMSSPATGNRGSATSKTRCIDVAALFASAILKKCPDAEVIPFDTSVHKHRLNPLDSIMTNAKTLATYGGGGTYCAKPLEYLNAQKATGDLVIYISDNESNVDPQCGRGTATMVEWKKFKARNKSAKLVNIDIQPNHTTQTNPEKDILNLGGFSDSVFETIKNFMDNNSNVDFWVKEIENTII